MSAAAAFFISITPATTKPAMPRVAAKPPASNPAAALPAAPVRLAAVDCPAMPRSCEAWFRPNGAGGTSFLYSASTWAAQCSRSTRLRASSAGSNGAGGLGGGAGRRRRHDGRRRGRLLVRISERPMARGVEGGLAVGNGLVALFAWPPFLASKPRPPQSEGRSDRPAPSGRSAACRKSATGPHFLDDDL